MLTKLQELTEEREEGFTLIELLVVILIIGILSAIAIPAFLNQRKSAVDSTLQADLASTAKQVENWVAKQGATEKPLELARIQNVTGQTELLPASGVATELTQMKVSDGAVIEVTGTSHGYCLRGVNEGGDEASPEKLGYVYASRSGGLQKIAGTCVNGMFTPGYSGGGGESSGPGYGGGESSGPGLGGGESSGPGLGCGPTSNTGYEGGSEQAGDGCVSNDNPDTLTHHTATVRNSDTWAFIQEIPYTVTRSTLPSWKEFRYTFRFSDSSINGSIDVNICNVLDNNCRDYELNVVNGEGSLTGDEAYSMYNGSMDTLMLDNNRLITLY